MKVGFISLGCSKNLVVTEEMIGLFKEHGFEIVNEEQEAEILLINTCGFIESAKKEAIDTILEMADYKQDKCKYLIVTGCLVERYEKEMKQDLPEVDLFVRVRDYPKFWELVSALLEGKQEKDELSFHKRMISTGNMMTYLKIAEGCSNCCTYCAIPMIQGRYISRDYDDILKEASELALKGYQELVVIAQDTTKYGIDLYGKSRLAELLHDISLIPGIHWIRFLYAYPESIDEDLIQEVKNNPKICHYFDIPIQHINDDILKKMHRQSDGESIRKLITHLREEIPDVIIRTTLIAGFPTETEEQYKELCDFVKEYKIDKLGCFAYSKEDKTLASVMDGQIPEKEKKRRANHIMALQQKISKEVLESKVGKTFEVLLEDITDDGEYFIGRTYMDVPSEDGVVFIPYSPKYGINEFTTCRITSSLEYDLVGEFIEQ